MRNLDLTSLRSFVAVADSGGVTRAAGFLNLTQSAVSMQLKRLEEALDLRLLERSGRGVALTPAGSQLLSYAKRMLDLNDEIYVKLTDQSWQGTVSLGVPEDIVYPVIPGVLKRMGVVHPRIRIDLISASTVKLKAQYARGAVDVILTTETGLDKGGETLKSVPLRWVGAMDGRAWQQRPLPVAFCRYCAFRDATREALDAAGLSWTPVVDSDNDRTVEATVSADLAVTAMLEGHSAPFLTEVDAGGALPQLQVHNINMYGQGARPELITPLMQLLRQGFAAL